jgi:hypothetical protein
LENFVISSMSLHRVYPSDEHHELRYVRIETIHCFKKAARPFFYHSTLSAFSCAVS